MFPSNLHKNIIQLDKQISLLENECKSIEAENKKNLLKPQQLHNKCNRVTKSSSLRVTTKKSSASENSKNAKKGMPLFSARVKSSSSLHSTYSKPWSEFTEPLVGKKIKRGVNKSNVNRGDCEPSQIITKKCTKCMCCDEEPSSPTSKIENDICQNSSLGKEEILHKEVLLSRSGERIEVTVTQKPNIDDIKENVPLPVCRKTCNTPEKDISCFCHLKGQKWSDILSVDLAKKKEVHKNCGSQINSDETSYTQQSSLSNSNKVINQCLNSSQVENSKNLLDEVYEVPVKLTANVKDVKKSEKKSEGNFEKKEFHSNIEDLKKFNLSYLLEFLIDELEQRPGFEKKKILSKIKLKTNDWNESQPVTFVKKLEEKKKYEEVTQSEDAKNGSQSIIQQPCKTVKEDVEVLSKELMDKNKTIALLQKREEEYISLISDLKKNLEKAKERVHVSGEAFKELETIKHKFLEHTKISEALKKSHSKMQQMLERYALENDKLKTQIQIYKLEAQKHDVLLAGKEAEVKRYREEIQNFQRQISDHLSALKSNAQAIDLEKMIKAFMHQSQLFLSKDDDAEKEIKETFSKQQNGLLHSSPTSTKTSVVNSSWKQISSIKEDNQIDVDFEINPKENNEKEYLHIFGDDSLSNSQSKTTLIEKFSSKKDKKMAPSFTSCLSVQDDDDDCGYSSTSKNDFSAKKENESLTSKKVQSNIDELLQQMKLKWSKKIHKTSESGTIEDFFNSSQISSISVVSGNTLPENVSSEKQ